MRVDLRVKHDIVARKAATFCSYVYLVCLPSMDSSTSLPNDRYT